MKNQNENEHFSILRKIDSSPYLTQRSLAKELGFSVGKLNYCIKGLNSKGLIKIKNFKKNPKKLNYLYLLTPKGISEKTKLTIRYMKKKLSEYDELKKELDKNSK
jgi:EPS-associated MarR family transcriptional regulator|tara:strand:+ start:801 stop:1115 length:315 start_codon:yes stop_codon:yes gene_type:complete